MILHVKARSYHTCDTEEVNPKFWKLSKLELEILNILLFNMYIHMCRQTFLFGLSVHKKMMQTLIINHESSALA